jgi:hypothetical protein
MLSELVIRHLSSQAVALRSEPTLRRQAVA